jgi:hypothetical protein
LITTIIRPPQEREEQTLNKEVQLQQGFETINTLVLALKVVIEQSKAALPADSTASNPVSLALTICDSVADNLHQQNNLQDRGDRSRCSFYKNAKVDEQAKADGDANRLRKETKRQKKKAKRAARVTKLRKMDKASLKKWIESCERELEHAKQKVERGTMEKHVDAVEIQEERIGFLKAFI